MATKYFCSCVQIFFYCMQCAGMTDHESLPQVDYIGGECLPDPIRLQIKLTFTVLLCSAVLAAGLPGAPEYFL